MLIQCLIWVTGAFVVVISIVGSIAYIFNNRHFDETLIVTLLFFVFSLPIIGSIELFIYRKINNIRQAQNSSE